MKRTMLILAVLVAPQPALAWDLSSEATKKTWSYAAFQEDKGGSVELQFYCEEVYPDEIQMLVFTDLDAEEGDEDFPTVSVGAVIDGQAFDDLVGYYDNVDGERAVVVDTLEEDRVREVIARAREAEQPLQISYDGRRHRFAAEGADDVLGRFVDGCKSQGASAQD